MYVWNKKRKPENRKTEKEKQRLNWNLPSAGTALITRWPAVKTFVAVVSAGANADVNAALFTCGEIIANDEAGNGDADDNDDVDSGGIDKATACWVNSIIMYNENINKPAARLWQQKLLFCNFNNENCFAVVLDKDVFNLSFILMVYS